MLFTADRMFCHFTLDNFRAIFDRLMSYLPLSLVLADADGEKILSYEPVTQHYPQPNRKRPIILIGPPDVGRQELRQRLMESDPDRFAAAVPRRSFYRNPNSNNDNMVTCNVGNVSSLNLRCRITGINLLWFQKLVINKLIDHWRSWKLFGRFLKKSYRIRPSLCCLCSVLQDRLQ